MKRLIIGGLLSGLIYASLGAGFDYSNGQEFRLWEFIFDLLFFGGMMIILSRWNEWKNRDR